MDASGLNQKCEAEGKWLTESREPYFQKALMYRDHSTQYDNLWEAFSSRVQYWLAGAPESRCTR